jgi:succinate-semialdehyde dehydrogenase/glutarate-semialdehyde dehydrogenase
MPTRVIGRAKDIGGEPTSNATVRKLTFTGSTEVGKLLMEQCAGTVKKLSLELGGNAPFIVFDDADIEAAVKGAIASKYRNAGQTCVCANRILVQDGVYDAFTKRLAETAGAMKVADGFEPGAVIGPLIDMKAVEKVEAHIADALKKGAKVVTGGKRAAQGGSFFEPTVLTDVTTDMVITKEETLARSPRPTASRPTPTRSRWPTTPNSASPPISTAATSAASGASPRPSNTASSASTRHHLAHGEIAPFGGMKESGIGLVWRFTGLEIRHRGIPRSQIPLHGRHRPVA